MQVSSRLSQYAVPSASWSKARQRPLVESMPALPAVVFVGHREAYEMEVYARVRRAAQVDGMSIRHAARDFGSARKTIRKMLQFSLPPGYERKRPVRRRRLGSWLGIIDQILPDGQPLPKNQRHTAKRIQERLKAAHGFGGSYTGVKDYVLRARLRRKEVFVPLMHRPGDAQVDFGEALMAIGGARTGFQRFDLPHYDDVPGREREHRGLPGGPQPGLRLFSRRAPNHLIRQHQDRRDGNNRRRRTEANRGIQRIAIALPPCGQARKLCAA